VPHGPRAARAIVFAACGREELRRFLPTIESAAPGARLLLVSFDDHSETPVGSMTAIANGLTLARAVQLCLGSWLRPFASIAVVVGERADPAALAVLVGYTRLLRGRQRLRFDAGSAGGTATAADRIGRVGLAVTRRLTGRVVAPAVPRVRRALARGVTAAGLRFVAPASSPSRPPGSRVALVVPVLPDLSHTFVYREVLALKQRHPDWLVIALERGGSGVIHAEAAALRREALVADGTEPHRYLRYYLRCWLTRPRHVARVIARFRHHVRTFAPAAPPDDPFLLCDVEQLNHSAHPIKGVVLARLLRRLQVGYVHVYGFTYPAVRALVAHDLWDIPFSLSTFVDFDYPSAFRLPVDKLEAARFVVACTGFCAGRLTALAPAADVRTLHHALPAAYAASPVFRSPGGPARLVFVGRFVEKKGLDTLVAAAGLLREREVSFSAHLYGDGEERCRLESLIERLQLTRHVRLEPPVPNQHFYSTMSRDDIFVSPCRYLADGDRDGIPVTLMEAMAAGVPVVSTTVSGIPELVVHGVNGFLVPPDDPLALADLLERLLAENSWRAGVADAARRTIREHFCLESTVERLDAWLTREIRNVSATAPPEPGRRLAGA
jgi:glycosyltransferase involved in cell wall biosynthesis